MADIVNLSKKGQEGEKLTEKTQIYNESRNESRCFSNGLKNISYSRNLFEIFGT